MPLTADLIAKEIIRILSLRLKEPLPWNFLSGQNRNKPSVTAWISPENLEDSLEAFAQKVGVPIAQELAKAVPPGAHFAELEMPQGNDLDCAGVSWDGIWLRVVIDPTVPVPAGLEAVWSRKTRYYNIQEDRFCHGPCGIILRADICPISQPTWPEGSS